MNLEDIFLPKCNDAVFKETSSVMLAFIGDAVHTLYVRDRVVKSGNLLLKDYHKKSANCCKAKAQAEKLDLILPNLTEIELDIIKRARNAKINTIAKNSDMETYKKATSYESLIGYLYLKGDFNRLKEILDI